MAAHFFKYFIMGALTKQIAVYIGYKSCPGLLAFSFRGMMIPPFCLYSLQDFKMVPLQGSRDRVILFSFTGTVSPVKRFRVLISQNGYRDGDISSFLVVIYSYNNSRALVAVRA